MTSTNYPKERVNISLSRIRDIYAGERGKIGLLVEPDKGLQSERIETDTD